MSLNQIFIGAAALLLAGVLLPLGPTMRGVLFVVMLGGGIIAMIGLGLNHLGDAFN
jgi:hypothetical protein